MIRNVIFAIPVSRPALGATQHLIQWIPGVKQPGRESDRSSLSSAEVKNAWSYTSTPLYVFKAWCLVKHRTTLRWPISQY